MRSVRYRNLGSSDLSVSEIALGTWLTLGSSVDRAGTVEIVQMHTELGLSLSAYASMVTDHLPVVAEFNIDNDND